MCEQEGNPLHGFLPRMRPTHNLYRLLDCRKRDCKPSNISIRSHYSVNVLFWIVSFCAKIFALVSLSMTKVSDLVNSGLSAWAEQPDFLITTTQRVITEMASVVCK